MYTKDIQMYKFVNYANAQQSTNNITKYGALSASKTVQKEMGDDNLFHKPCQKKTCLWGKT